MDTTEVHELTLKTLKEHGLHEWKVRWSPARRWLGMCEYSKKTIALSKPLIEANDHKVALDTIYHEIAHALVGPGKGHGPEWKAMARALGAVPRATTRDVTAPPSRYFSIHDCGTEFTRNRLPSTNRYCGKCLRRSGGDYGVSILTWVDRRSNMEVGTASAARVAQMIGR